MATAGDQDRIDETLDGVEHLQTAMEAWFSHRIYADQLGQYSTQLERLHGVLEPSIGRVRSEVETLRSLGRTGEIRAECRRNDRRTHLLERYWRYFAEKWDQRDHAYEQTLLAADEIVWSCWSPTFKAAGESIAAAPLPYIEPFYTPRAIPRTSPPPDVQRADPLLRSALETMPVPLIGLPPVVHARPWLLAVLAHEIGHHVQRDLAGGAFFKALPAALDEAASRQDRPTVGWRRSWHEELFADAFSILSVGPAAAAATAEMLGTDESLMLTEDDAYPSTAIRELLMDRILLRCGNAAAERVPGYAAPDLAEYELPENKEELRTCARTHELALESVAQLLMSDLIGNNRALATLCGWQPERHATQGEVDRWRQTLSSNTPLVPDVRQHAARSVVAGGFAAWQVFCVEDDPVKRADQRDRLAERLHLLLPMCRPEGRRGAPTTASLIVAEATESLNATLFSDEIEVAG